MLKYGLKRLYVVCHQHVQDLPPECVEKFAIWFVTNMYKVYHQHVSRRCYIVYSPSCVAKVVIRFDSRS